MQNSYRSCLNKYMLFTTCCWYGTKIPVYLTQGELNKKKRIEREQRCQKSKKKELNSIFWIHKHFISIWLSMWICVREREPKAETVSGFHANDTAHGYLNLNSILVNRAIAMMCLYSVRCGRKINKSWTRKQRKKALSLTRFDRMTAAKSNKIALAS